MASQRPARTPQPGWQSPTNDMQRPTPQPTHSSGSVQFQPRERGDRAAPISSRYSQQQPPPTSPRDRNLPPTPQNMQDEEYAAGGGDSWGTRVGRKKSLVRPEREKLDPAHRLFHYRTHAAQLEDEGRGPVKPSTTGQAPGQLRRGISVLGRDDGARLNRRNTRRNSDANVNPLPEKKSGSWLDNIAPGPKDAWMIYCWLLTIWVPGFVLKWFGIKTPDQARAWREKMGLLGLIFLLMAAVGFLTFGFTQTVCGKPPLRYRAGTIDRGSLIINGYDYDFSEFKHPPVDGFFDGQQNPLFTEPYNAGGMDASFLFQNVNRNCRGLITPAANTPITNSNGALAWYFPCNTFDQNGKSLNSSGYDKSTFCHTDSTSRQMLAAHPPNGQVFFTWDDVKNSGRNLVVFESFVLDLSLLQALGRGFVQYPPLFDTLKTNNNMTGRDITMTVYRNNMKADFRCLQDIVTVGFIDTNTIGCVASEVVLVLSLVFIIGVVAIRFVMAVIFGWFVSWRLGAFGPPETYSQRMERAAAIENWTDDIYRPAPSRYRPTVRNDSNGNEKLKKDRKSAFFPNTSRYTQVGNSYGQRPISVADLNFRRGPASKGYLSPPEAPGLGYGGRYSRSSTSLTETAKWSDPSLNSSACPWPLHNVVPQPPSDYMPFNFPLAHTICLVTAYSEGESGLRTTLDSIATTDYPNSHKLIMVIADGLVKGSGNSLTTPDIVLTMMKEFIIPPEEVQPHSYVAIADGHKRHNMAKVYAGFYDYDNSTVEISKQQRVPVILIAKCGNPLEAKEAKPGNRGKRDSQIVLMAFLQKVMFDERMTTMEYEFFNAIWRVTGITPDRYEFVLCVDADTKVFPDSLTRMAACMSNDQEIMGLCGETKIGNKAESWVTMIQVFEYYISHHLTKAFESMFGGVTCLPGCFSMYRIKSQKGDKGFWVPILANPDIVEHYSENIVDTLHKKNLLLLGEDRYLTTLMLKTFPRRKMMFCPQAVCKTTVPDQFSVLLSQRRRWINSTIHNLAELLLVRDLCGTFCFSMQFVVFMELMGTLVLPAAISFTIYLIVISIIPNHQNTTIPLVLLGIILGLPGLLIVLTSRRLAYVGWMLIYLLSLPIWNFVLPAYAFWHFDDFSWGTTRQVSGEKKGAGGHGGGDTASEEDVFDSDKIVMKRWAEFERERRWKSGSTSRDSMYYSEKFDNHSNSPRRPDDYAASTRYDDGYRPRVESAANSNRFSMVSDSEPSYTPPAGYASVENDQYNRAPTVQLPAPLGRPTSASTNPSPSRSSLDTFNGGVDTSRQRLISTPPSAEYHPPDDHDSVQSPSTIESHMNRIGGGVLRQSTISTQYPVEQSNPYRYSQPQAASYDDHYSAEPEEVTSPHTAVPFIPPQGYNGYNSRQQQQQRGISLADNGPVPGPDGVRRVARNQARRSTQQQTPPPSGANNRYSRSSTYGGYNMSSLPPGAAPPTNPYGYR